MPELGYQEVHLAKAFAKLGHRVAVMTSTALSPSARNAVNLQYQPGDWVSDNNYLVKRFSPLLKSGAIVIVSGILKALRIVKPDIVIVIGLSKLFPFPLLLKKKTFRIIGIFGDNANSLSNNNKSGSIVEKLRYAEINFRMRLLYRRAVKVFDVLVMNVPETSYVFEKLLSKKLVSLFYRKRLQLNLGFDPELYFFSLNEREQIRKELGVDRDTFVLITSTRVTREKKINELIDCVKEIKRSGLKVHYILVGLLGDSYEEELRNCLTEENNCFFSFIPFSDSNSIRGYYNAADIGVWTRPAISIIEAMGTGLKVCLPPKDSLSHLITEECQGVYYDTNKLYETLENQIKNRNDFNGDLRGNTALINKRRFSYLEISNKLLSVLEPMLSN